MPSRQPAKPAPSEAEGMPALQAVNALQEGSVSEETRAGGVPLCNFVSFVVMMFLMRYIVRFLWNATRGHHLAPWRSPYLLWRIETYCGVKMQQIGVLEFWEFTWRERKNLWRFLKWTAEMERYAHPKPKGS